jgi:hypothetical protein
MVKDDPFLSECTDVGKGIRILTQDKWEMIVSFIISQRKSIPAIQTSIERLCKLSGKEIEEGFYSFPSPGEILLNADSLSTCGLGYRQDYILKAAELFYENPNLEISNLMTKIKDPVDAVNFTVPKVITNKDGIGIYLTRTTAPYPKGSLDYAYYKQVCVYGFKPDALQFYCDYGMKYGKAKVEAVEDIEILRFIENGDSRI